MFGPKNISKLWFCNPKNWNMIVRLASAFFVVCFKSSKKEEAIDEVKATCFWRRRNLFNRLKVKRTFKSGDIPKFEPLKNKRKFKPL